MRRSIALVLAATLCVTPVALVACGGIYSDGGDGTASVQQDLNAKDKFVGTWKPVYMEFDGWCWVRAYSKLIGKKGSLEYTPFEYVLIANGTGSALWEVKRYDITWKLIDDDHAVITGRDFVDQTVRYDKEHDTLCMDATAEDPTVVVLAKNDKSNGSYGLKLSDAVPAKSLSEVVGDWTIYGICMNDAMVYGDLDKHQDEIGDTSQFALVIETDGSASVLDYTDWKVEEEDGTVKLVRGNHEVPVMRIDDLLVLDMGDEEHREALIYKK